MDRAAFERLALEHLDALHRMAMRLTRKPEDAADLVQETYLRALRASENFEERGGGIRSWLFTILHNVFYTQAKRRSMAPASVGEFFAERDPSATPPGEAPTAWDLKSFDWDHVDERLKAAVESLDEEHQLMLLLWGVEGLKYREIAHIMGIPIGTVMSRLHRARKQVVEALGREALADLGADLGAAAREADHD